MTALTLTKTLIITVTLITSVAVTTHINFNLIRRRNEEDREPTKLTSCPDVRFIAMAFLFFRKA